MNTSKTLLFATFTIVTAPLPFVMAQNLFVNGDFSAGATGFSSDYQDIQTGYSQTPGTYGIRSVSQAFNPSSTQFYDHTTGSGLMMLVNSSTQNVQMVWSQTASFLTPNTLYRFSMWVAAAEPVNPPVLAVFINGAQIGLPFFVSGTAGQWQQFSAVWNSGTSTSANCIVADLDGPLLVNYFALDDLDFEDASFQAVGAMGMARALHTATLLPNGKVLVAAGQVNDGGTFTHGVSEAELYDPATGTWAQTAFLATSRYGHTATLLPNGKVLVAGGYDVGSGSITSSELYDPGNPEWTGTGALLSARAYHTATLLPDGRVLVVGGTDSFGNPVASAEIYDPAANGGLGAWAATASLKTARSGHTATLLPNGKVLVAGGSGSTILSSAEVYDPAGNAGHGAWTATNPMKDDRMNHTATLLPDGTVLVAGGQDTAMGAVSTAEVYDPSVAGGTWTMTDSMADPCYGHTATLLASGKVLVYGGDTSGISYRTELYDPSTSAWTAGGVEMAPSNAQSAGRASHTATLLPNGKVLAAGGFNGEWLASAELYDPTISPPAASWTPTTGPLPDGESGATATLLTNGQVLIAGGFVNGNASSSTATYDPLSGRWTSSGNMKAARADHTATLLPDGTVLVAGGIAGASGSEYALSSVELYNPFTRDWTLTNSLLTARADHTATLLANGKVLVTGGFYPDNEPPFSISVPIGVCEFYDPGTGLWEATGSLVTPRAAHTATLLPTGKVLVAGGFQEVGRTATAELYDPASKVWTQTNGMTFERYGHTATLLPNGQVLVAGGYGGNNGFTVNSSAELFDPVAGNWSRTGAMRAARADHTATLLLGGNLLVAGGYDRTNNLSSAELYDPAVGTWVTTTSMTSNRRSQSATLLPNGNVLVAGGYNGNYLSGSELYDTGLGFSSSWRPLITSLIPPLAPGSSLALAGSQFRGISEASGGNGSQDSPADYPVVQLRSLESGQNSFLLPSPTANWSATSFTSEPLIGMPPGWTLATVFVNGIPSTSAIFDISVPVPHNAPLRGAKKLASGAFQCSFTNSPGAQLTMLATTNISLPLSNWTMMSGIMEVSPGQFLFMDTQASSNAQRFYRLRSQ